MNAVNITLYNTTIHKILSILVVLYASLSVACVASARESLQLVEKIDVSVFDPQ